MAVYGEGPLALDNRRCVSVKRLPSDTSGASDFVTKPYNPERISSALQKTAGRGTTKSGCLARRNISSDSLGQARRVGMASVRHKAGSVVQATKSLARTLNTVASLASVRTRAYF